MLARVQHLQILDLLPLKHVGGGGGGGGRGSLTGRAASDTRADQLPYANTSLFQETVVLDLGIHAYGIICSVFKMYTYLSVMVCIQ